MREHKHAAVLRAIADGKEVEWCRWNETEWHGSRIHNPMSDWQLEWRIKPQPPIVRNLCFAADNDGYLKVCSEKPNVRVTFDPETKLPIKVELI